MFHIIVFNVTNSSNSTIGRSETWVLSPISPDCPFCQRFLCYTCQFGALSSNHRNHVQRIAIQFVGVVLLMATVCIVSIQLDSYSIVLCFDACELILLSHWILPLAWQLLSKSTFSQMISISVIELLNLKSFDQVAINSSLPIRMEATNAHGLSAKLICVDYFWQKNFLINNRTSATACQVSKRWRKTLSNRNLCPSSNGWSAS